MRPATGGKRPVGGPGTRSSRPLDGRRRLEGAVADAPSGEATPAASEPASRIGHVIDMINRIAAENNLAALRATIEAARAGDAVAADPRPRSQVRRPGRTA